MTRRGAFVSARAVALVLLVLVTATAGRSAAASPPPSRVALDRVVVRFYAPEMGGASRPRFVFERTLAFEARMEAMANRPDGYGDGYGSGDLRAALEHHVAEEVLASLADKLIAGTAVSQRPTGDELDAVTQRLAAALFDRLGGRARVEAAAEAEQLGAAELDTLLRRQALAAWYIDHAIAPILTPRDDQLREVYRTSTHPFRGQSYEHAKDALARWFVLERVRASETAFLQSARSRLHISVT